MHSVSGIVRVNLLVCSGEWIDRAKLKQSFVLAREGDCVCTEGSSAFSGAIGYSSSLLLQQLLLLLFTPGFFFFCCFDCSGCFHSIIIERVIRFQFRPSFHRKLLLHRLLHRRKVLLHRQRVLLHRQKALLHR